VRRQPQLVFVLKLPLMKSCKGVYWSLYCFANLLNIFVSLVCTCSFYIFLSINWVFLPFATPSFLPKCRNDVFRQWNTTNFLCLRPEIAAFIFLFKNRSWKMKSNLKYWCQGFVFMCQLKYMCNCSLTMDEQLMHLWGCWPVIACMPNTA